MRFSRNDVSLIAPQFGDRLSRAICKRLGDYMKRPAYRSASIIRAGLLVSAVVGLSAATVGVSAAQDFDAATVKWNRLAAEQGNVWAQYLLGIMYDNGDVVPQDDAVAVKWYRLAAEQGHVSA